MAKYCITAAKHQNKENHCASKFKTWRYDPTRSAWVEVGWKSLNEISELLAGNHEVLSGQVNPLTKQPVTGAKVEVELRIAKNGTRFNISEMPDS